MDGMITLKNAAADDAAAADVDAHGADDRRDICH